MVAPFIRALRLTPEAADYSQQIPALRTLRQRPLKIQTPVTVFVGDNGSGKSTLLSMLALSLGFAGTGGYLGDPNREYTGFEPQARGIIVDRHRPILRGLYHRSDMHYQILQAQDNSDYQHHLQQRSHGESLTDLLGFQINGAGLYILDEPEAGLSVVRQMAIVAEIHQAVDRGAQFFIATHSPVFLAWKQAQLFDLNDDLQEVSFHQAEPVTATKEFLSDPQGTLDYLLS